jgi:hypothetical protein
MMHCAKIASLSKIAIESLVTRSHLKNTCSLVSLSLSKAIYVGNQGSDKFSLTRVSFLR